MSYFWNGYVLRDFVFPNLNTHTIPGFVGVFIALFSVGVLYEALFHLKKLSLQKFLHLRSSSGSRRRSSCPSFQRSVPDEPPSSSAAAGDNPRHSLLEEGDGDCPPITSPGASLQYLLLSSILHALYVFLGYTLMNAVMTFNIWVLVAVTGGVGLGYLVFRTDYPLHHAPSPAPREGVMPGIETDEGEEGGGKTDRSSTESPSSTSSRRSKNRQRAALQLDHPESLQPPPPPLPPKKKNAKAAAVEATEGNGGPPVLVVGAQVHHNDNTYQPPSS